MATRLDIDGDRFTFEIGSDDDVYVFVGARNIPHPADARPPDLTLNHRQGRTHMTTAKPATHSNPKTAATKEAAAAVPEKVTLDQLAREMKLPPRDARMLLRLAAKQTKLYPTLGAEHVARQPWSWTPGSKALDEAKKALSASQDI